MRMLFGIACLAAALAMVTGGDATGQDKKDMPKYTIKEVMKKAHGKKDGVLNKVTSGKGSDADAKDLLEMYVALSMDKPPQGDAEDWKIKTTALVDGAKLVVDGKKDAGIEKLKAASNCMACHKLHKPG